MENRTRAALTVIAERRHAHVCAGGRGSAGRFVPLVAGFSDRRRRIHLDGGARSGKDRKSTRLNSSHTVTSYAGVCLKKAALGIVPAASREPGGVAAMRKRAAHCG